MHLLAVRRDLVFGVGVDDIFRFAAADRVALTVDGPDRVLRASAGDDVSPPAAVQRVVVGATGDPVVPAAAVDRVRTQCAVDPVVASSAADDIGVFRPGQDIASRRPSPRAPVRKAPSASPVALYDVDPRPVAAPAIRLRDH